MRILFLTIALLFTISLHAQKESLTPLPEHEKDFSFLFGLDFDAGLSLYKGDFGVLGSGGLTMKFKTKRYLFIDLDKEIEMGINASYERSYFYDQDGDRPIHGDLIHTSFLVDRSSVGLGLPVNRPTAESRTSLYRDLDYMISLRYHGWEIRYYDLNSDYTVGVTYSINLGIQFR